MRSNVYGNDGQFIGSIEEADFLDRRGKKIGTVRDGNVYSSAGEFVCGLQKLDDGLARDSLSSGEFARRVEAH